MTVEERLESPAVDRKEEGKLINFICGSEGLDGGFVESPFPSMTNSRDDLKANKYHKITNQIPKAINSSIMSIKELLLVNPTKIFV